MYKIMKDKGQAKLLAAVMALAMVACAIFVFAPADESDAADGSESAPTEISSFDGLISALNANTDGTYILKNSIEGTITQKASVTNNIIIDLNGFDVDLETSLISGNPSLTDNLESSR